MKILQINKYFYLKGGAERYYFDLCALLEKNGHEIIHFSQADSNNFYSAYSSFFPKTKYRFFWSWETARKLEVLIKKNKPDIAHVHLIYHHLTPSILAVLKKYKIPVVMTVHDYKLICPNYSLYTQGAPCERCCQHKYYQCAAHRCIKDSYIKSGLVALEMYGHKIFKSYEKNINIFIAPSEFAKAELIKFGLSENKIKVINHFANVNHADTPAKTGDYLLYFGRIADNKGLDKLLHALYISKLSCKLKIAGSGPYLSEIRKLIIDYHLNNVELLGHLNTAELNKQIAGAMAIVVPSVVWETFGLTVLEAYAQNKIVIAHQSGALPEIVKEGETGYLYASENELIEKINLVINNKERLINLGSNAKKFLQTKYNPENHYQQLLAVYCGLRPDQP